ncbi:MAG: hypothetical protein RR139_01525 [Lachnospiraceae bacterium]
MKDAIDKRNEKQKIARSIVKRSNVVYITKEELKRRQEEEEENAKKQLVLEQERERAEEILRRLELEAEADEAKKTQEIEAIKYLNQSQEEAENRHKMYGQNPMDGITQEKVGVILSDNDKKIEKLFKEANEKKD